MSDIEIGAFLSGPRHPEQDALLRLIGTLIIDPQRADADEELSRERTGMEWSDRELRELGNLIIRRLSIEEIARLLGRTHGDVQDKVVEVSRACR
jgi:hypothetical protein